MYNTTYDASWPQDLLGCTSSCNLVFEKDSGNHNFDSKFILVAISVEFLVVCSLYKPTYNEMGKVCTQLSCHGLDSLPSLQLAHWIG